MSPPPPPSDDPTITMDDHKKPTNPPAATKPIPSKKFRGQRPKIFSCHNPWCPQSQNKRYSSGGFEMHMNAYTSCHKFFFDMVREQNGRGLYRSQEIKTVEQRGVCGRDLNLEY